MENEHTLMENEVQEKAHAFGRRLVASVIKNLFLKTALWTVVFLLLGYLYSKMIFPEEGGILGSLRAVGSLAALVIYLAGGIITGLCFGALSAVRNATEQMSEIIGTGVSMAFVKFLPGDRDTISIEEVRRILDRVAPPEGGLAGLPLRLVRKRVENDLLNKAASEGPQVLGVAQVKDYVTDKLAGTAVRDIRIKAMIGQLVGWFIVFIFLVLPLLLVLIF